MKKKLFVLREESRHGGPARLEYYDSEKKLKNGAAPKRSIILSTCFSINTKSDARHKHALALFTKDDCFTVVCDGEEEQRAWLQAMLELRNVGTGDEGMAIPLFGKSIYASSWPYLAHCRFKGNWIQHVIGCSTVTFWIHISTSSL